MLRNIILLLYYLTVTAADIGLKRKIFYTTRPPIDILYITSIIESSRIYLSISEIDPEPDRTAGQFDPVRQDVGAGIDSGAARVFGEDGPR